jgi:AcrR family transcriptional regulator
MLIHHFGSKEGLLVEVIRAVEARQRAILAELGDRALSEQGSGFWEHLRSPELAPQERLFFEVYGQALRGRPWAKPLLDGIVENWIGPVATLLEAEGASPGWRALSRDCLSPWAAVCSSTCWPQAR